MLIAGWPEPGPYSVINTLASLAELMVNLAFSVVVIYGARRLLRRA